ncbi:hypothetical protein, partial [Klebsiella pneumoniae]|uniref:hypothetical protein n=1 Tax=Klebsiella pneumoniae TaxID=573 RepID=UPI001C2FC00D
GSCAAPSAKGDDKFITTDYLQQCPKNTQSDELNQESIHHNNMIIKRDSHMNRGQFVSDSP